MSRPVALPGSAIIDDMDKWLEPYALSAFRRSADVAHDLKTPLNVAVLNLELLRMRIRKLSGDDDAKVDGYIKAIDLELRRMGRIFDAYFVYASPLRDAAPPEAVGASALLRESVEGLTVASEPGEFPVVVHPARLKELFRLFSEGARKIFAAESIVITESESARGYLLAAAGDLILDEAEVGKIFKFYYTDASGSPDLSLATARLIAETCGGSLDLVDQAPGVRLELSLPLGER
jgi:signal transduction histidine kinase